MSESPSLLKIEGVCKTFPGVRALDDVTLELHAGEVHALMGENGAGKSTLIKVLTGVYLRDAGQVRFEGRAIEPKSPREAEAIGISTVYQEINLIPDLSVAENIMLGRAPRRFGFVHWSAMEAKARDALKRLSLELDVKRSVVSYPPAIRQMIAIARALAVDAKLLVLDEPTSSLDENEVAQLFKVMKRLRGEGLGIVFVTHFLEQVYAISDKITVLRNGRSVGQYQTSELPKLKLIETMLGRSVGDAVDSGSGDRAGEAGAPLLSARALKRQSVVGPIDFDLYAGQVMGLAGLLGSGRTETARMLFGIDPADGGQVSVANKLAKLDTPRAAIQHGIAYCAEDRKLDGIIPNLSVRENLILALQASKGAGRMLPRSEQDAIAKHYIEALRIKTPDAETPIKNLSGGNQQKVLLGRWLAMQPQIIILDEPTRGIDVGAKLEIEKLIHSLGERGVATIFISSELEEVTRICSRVLVLRDRLQVADLSGSDVEVDRIMRVIAAGQRENTDA